MRCPFRQPQTLVGAEEPATALDVANEGNDLATVAKQLAHDAAADQVRCTRDERSRRCEVGPATALLPTAGGSLRLSLR